MLSCYYVFILKNEKRVNQKKPNIEWLKLKICNELKTNYFTKSTEKGNTIEFKKLDDLACNFKILFDDLENNIRVEVRADSPAIKKCCKTLDDVNTIIYQSNINHNYKIINTYNGYSNIYCNKLYEKLSNFERILRKFMYDTYISNFDLDFNTKTLNESQKSEIKANIKKNSKKEKLLFEEHQIFDFIDFGTINDILFNEQWTEVETELYEQVIRGIKDNSIDKVELSQKVSLLKPRSDWERLFSVNGTNLHFKNQFNDIRNCRNKVAHNRNFTFEEFNSMKSTITSAQKTIMEMSSIVNSDSFKNSNDEYLSISHKQLVNSFVSSLDYSSSAAVISKSISDMRGIQEFSRVFSERLNEIRKISSPLNNGVNPVVKPINEYWDNIKK